MQGFDKNPLVGGFGGDEIRVKIKYGCRAAIFVVTFRWTETIFR